MDSLKMKFAAALCFWLGFAIAEPVFAQSSTAPAQLSATVDGVRGRCGLGLLARTTSGQTCQSFKDYGSRMQCVANDLSDEVRAKESPVFAEVANCYRALGDALVAGRGASNDQVNALEDVCRNLRHETVMPRSPGARDVLLLASDALMPSFSRRAVAVPTNSPLMGIRLHDLPDCALALSIPQGPPSTVGTPGPNRVSRAGNGVTTSAVQSPRFAYLTPPGADLTPAPSSTPFQAVPAILADGQTTNVDARGGSVLGTSSASASATKPLPLSEERTGAEKLSDGIVDRTVVGKSKVRTAAEISAQASISESAVISALPAVSMSTRKPLRRTTSRAERNPSGYGVATAADGRSPQRTSVAVPVALGSQSGARSSNPNGYGAGYSASSPPSLPLTGPPLRPQTAGSVR